MRVHHEDPDRSPAGRALLLPGANYHAGLHGLYWPLRTLRDHGWSVTRAEWDAGEWGDDPDGFIERAVARLAAEVPDAPRTLVMGKSIGSLAIPWAADRGLPGIWLTPLLHLAHVRDGLAREPRSLLVGGTADESWAPDDALRERHEVVEVEGMNHGMLVGTGWRESFAAMARILAAVDDFLEHQL